MFDSDAPSSPSPLLVRAFSHAQIEKAVNGLYKNTPQNSARGVLSTVQKTALGVLLFCVLILAALAPLSFLIVVNIVTATYFMATIAYRFLLMALSTRSKSSPASAPEELIDPPVVTILAPLYKDAVALASLGRAIDALDYPTNRKDVKLLLEKDDHETLNEAKRLHLDRKYEIIVVPPKGPQTKPKACNFGLLCAKGEFIVIYDAEDQPEPDQLKKAVAAFRQANGKLACLQARLNYYNAEENWLTRGIMAQMTES